MNLNKNGFTLIELLAVIVVLAILMLIATNNVLPMIEKSRKGAFATTANQLVESATNYQMYKNLSSTSAAENSLCTTADKLITEGYVDKITAGTYTGTIYIGRNSDSSYQKIICIEDVKNNYFICKDVSANIVTADDITTTAPTSSPYGMTIGSNKVNYTATDVCS